MKEYADANIGPMIVYSYSRPEILDSKYAFPYTLRDRFKSEFLKEDSDTAIAYGKALGNSGKPMPTALQ